MLTSRTHGYRHAAALAAALAAGPMALAQTYMEVEPNDSKATANVIPLMQPGETIGGFTQGSSTTTAGVTSADYFRINVAPAVPVGIYKNVLTATGAGTSQAYTITLRGLTQTAGTINPGTDGQLNTSSSTITPRFNQWYSFGRGEQAIARITGTSGASGTNGNYTMTLTREVVTPVVATTTFSAGGVTISTIGQTTANTDFWVYDSNFNPVPTFGNDDNTVAGGGPGTGNQSIATRNLTPGTYYVAISTSNLSNNQSAPSDERSTGASDTVWDGPDALATGATLQNAIMNTLISDGAGNSELVMATKVGPLDVVFIQFTVGAAASIIVNSADVNPNPVTPGSTVATFTVNITPAPTPPNMITTATLDLTQLGGPAMAPLFDDGTNGDAVAGDNIYSLAYPVPGNVAPGTRVVGYTIGDNGGRSVSGNIAVTANSVVPSNDDCFGATVLTDAAFPFSETVGINLAGPDINFSCGTNSNNGIWYSYTPASDVIFQMRETGTRDVTFVIFDGSCFAFEGYCEPTETDANRLLTAGTEYLILVATPGTASTNPNDAFSLTFDASPVPAAPANDDCINATDLTGGTFPMTFTADAGGARPDADVSCNGSTQFNAANGIWFKYTATQDVYLAVQETDSTIFGQFTVYTQCGGSEVACRLLGGTSANIVPLAGGETYQILISRNRQGPADAHYDLVLDIQPNPVPNGKCAGAIPITSFPFTDTRQNVYAFNGPGVPCVTGSNSFSRNAVWYTITAETSMTINFRESSPQDAFVAIFTGACGALQPYFCNTFTPLTDVTHRLRLEGGQTYSIMVARESTTDVATSDVLTFVVHDVSMLPPVPDNDLCSAATQINQVPFRGSVLHAGATPDVKTACSLGTASNGSLNGVWYRYDNGGAASVGVVSTRPPNQYPSKSQIAVFQGSCPTGDFQEIACHQSSSDPETVTFDMQPSTSYYIMLADSVFLQAHADETINFTFDVLVGPAPTAPNGTCSTATPITSLPFSDFVWSAGAPNDTTDVACNSGTSLNNAVWYSYTATADGVAVFRENGPQDAVLAVFTSCPAVSGTEFRCASTDDVGILPMTAGTTYSIVVARFATTPSNPADYWDFHFDFVPAPTNDLCESATPIDTFPFRQIVPIETLTDDAFAITGCTSASPQRRGVWYTFTARDSFVLMGEELGPQTGSRVWALFSGGCAGLTQVGCSNNSTTGSDFDTVSPVAMRVVAGQTYFLLVGSRTATVTNPQQQFYDIVLYTLGSDVGRCSSSSGCVLTTGQNCATSFVPGLPPCAADFNCDGEINPDDLSDFITCFFTQVSVPNGCPAADFNHDGNFDPDDLSDYITLFFTATGGGPCG